MRYARARRAVRGARGVIFRDSAAVPTSRFLATPLTRLRASTGGGSSSSSSDDGQGVRSLLDSVLLAKWEEASSRGLFRYDVTACPTRMLDGVYGFIAQLNEGRATKKRLTECPADAVVQPWDDSKFNFGKAAPQEVLFQFEPSLPGSRRRGAAGSGGPAYSEAGPVAPSPSLVVINVSPIEYGHVLLVPRALSRLPQQLSAETLRLAFAFAAEADNPYFRVGYNSMGAFATINHLHFQGYYLAAPFPIERAPTAALPGSWAGVRVCRVTAYPLACLALEAGASLAEMARVLAAACEALQAANVPFNLLICDRGARVFLMPQRFAAALRAGEVPEQELASGINPAAFELAGHLLYKQRSDFDAASQESAWRLLQAASLTQPQFSELVATILPRMAAAAASAEEPRTMAHACLAPASEGESRTYAPGLAAPAVFRPFTPSSSE